MTHSAGIFFADRPPEVGRFTRTFSGFEQADPRGARYAKKNPDKGMFTQGPDDQLIDADTGDPGVFVFEQDAEGRPGSIPVDLQFVRNTFGSLPKEGFAVGGLHLPFTPLFETEADALASKQVIVEEARERFGPDLSSGVTPDQVQQLKPLLVNLARNPPSTARVLDVEDPRTGQTARFRLRRTEEGELVAPQEGDVVAQLPAALTSQQFTKAKAAQIPDKDTFTLSEFIDATGLTQLRRDEPTRTPEQDAGEPEPSSNAPAPGDGRAATPQYARVSAQGRSQQQGDGGGLLTLALIGGVAFLAGGAL